MAYRLEADEMLSTGIRRLLLERVNQIIEDLTIAPEGRDKGIHDARKNCKRVRAAYRLIRDGIGVDLYRQENIRFRDTSRLLAGARDSWVMIRTLDRLIADPIEKLPPQAFSGIRQQLVEKYEITLAQELANQTRLPAIVKLMQAACIQIENLPIAGEDFSVFQRGIRRVYTRGRSGLRLAYAQPEADRFHEWRKRVKYLRYQLEILQVLWPNMLSQLADELHSLSEYLGDDHDLAVLREVILQIPSGFADEQELMLLVGLIDQKRLALEALARPLGSRIYFDPPKTFAHRLEIYWQAWQAEGDEYQAETIQHLRQVSATIFKINEVFLTTTEIAARLKISPEAVRRLIHQQKLPAEKVGAVWVIRADSRLFVPHSVDIFDGVLLSTREAAARLDITPNKVRDLIQSGKLTATKAGHIWVIQAGDLTRLDDSLGLLNDQPE